MRSLVRLLAAAVVVAGVPVVVGVTGAADTRTMTGSYEWSDTGKKGNLEAVFTPAGEEKWDVSFHFVFEGQKHVYSGTAQGNLTTGDLRGRVQNEGGNRTWTFKGAFEDGKFKGTHAEVQKDGEHATGTLHLKG